MFKKSILYFNTLLIAIFLGVFSPTFAQNDLIEPSLTGTELIDYLQDNFTPTSPKSYNSARDAMYGSIDNKNGQIIGVYTGFTITANTRGDAFNKGINTEHTWPQGLFDKDEPMRGDIHHLYPTRIEANSARSNYPFDEIPDNLTDKWFYLDGDQSSIPSSNIDLYSELDNGSRFEPREDHKGNVARAIFYFWTIYQDRSNVADDASFFNGMKDVLLTWHDLDPVDNAEVTRSNAVEGVQGNKNPFIHDTTLVRRAYFGGGTVEPDPVPNPVTGTIIDIENSSFVLNYNDEGANRSTMFSYNAGTQIQDTAGSAITLTDYSRIEEAEVRWTQGNSDDEYIADEILVIMIEEEGDTVITGPTARPQSLILTGIFDATLSGGTPKGVELFALTDIPDLGMFGIGSASNGGGTDGVEFTLSGSVAKNEFIYVATESSNFNAWFGFDPDFNDTFGVAVNGDDAVELFFDSTKAFTGSEIVIDTFGEIDVDGTGTSWEYTDGWAYRKSFTEADSSIFNSNNWTFSGPDALENESSNSTATNPVPIRTFEPKMVTSNENLVQKPSSIRLLQNYPNPFNPQTIIPFEVNKPTHVRLEIYNVLGKRVAMLINQPFSEGAYSHTFDASILPGGVYYYRLTAGEFSETKAMILIK
ncbi:MAG: endonuclease [bacterium]|nr:endonuclease [bacterium]